MAKKRRKPGHPTARSTVDWALWKTNYSYNTSLTHRSIAEAVGVNPQTVTYHAKREKWADERERIQAGIAQKAQEGVANAVQAFHSIRLRSMLTVCLRVTEDVVKRMELGMLEPSVSDLVNLSKHSTELLEQAQHEQGQHLPPFTVETMTEESIQRVYEELGLGAEYAKAISAQTTSSEKSSAPSPYSPLKASS